MSVGNSRYLCIGPGGRNCNCCFPAPGSKDRRAQFRSAKRKAERAATREIERDLIDMAEMEHEAMYEDDYDDYDLFLQQEDEYSYSIYDDYGFDPYYRYDDYRY